MDERMNETVTHTNYGQERWSFSVTPEICGIFMQFYAMKLQELAKNAAFR
jgi:hypothetical protein